MQIGYPKSIINLALKGLHYLIQIKHDKYMNQIVEIVWRMLPSVLSSYRKDTGLLKIPLTLFNKLS